MTLCFLDDYEILQFKTTHPEGWIRLARPESSNAPEPVWGFSNDTQFLGFSSGHRPWILSSNSIQVPEATAFSVQETLCIDQTGQLRIQPPAHLPWMIHEDTICLFGTYAHLSSDTIDLQPVTILRLASSNMILHADKGISMEGSVQFTHPAVFHSNIDVPSLRVAQSITVCAPDGRIDVPKATFNTLCVQESLVSILRAEGSIYLSSQSQSLSLSPSQDAIILNGSLQFPASNTTIKIESPSASLVHHGTLSLPTPTHTHRIAGTIEVSGGFQCIGKPAEFQKGAEIHQSCIIGQPHRSAEMIVYGSTHFSKSLYAHDNTYFDKSVRFSAPVYFSPTACETRQTAAIEIPKGALMLQEGHLWINAGTDYTDYTFYTGGNAYINGTFTTNAAIFQANVSIHGNTTLHAPLTVTAGGLTVSQGGLKVTTGGVTIAQGGLAIADGGLKVSQGGITVAAGGLAVAQGGLAVQSGNLVIAQGGLTADQTLRITHGNIEAPNGSLQGQSLFIQDGQFAFQDGRLIHRHRRYGIYEPIAKGARWFKCLTIPYRMGRQSFYAKLNGTFISPTHTKTFQVEFGGITGSPNIKRSTITGSLGVMESAARIWVYQDTQNNDFHLYIELTYRAEIGLELDIVVGAGTDIFTWDTTPPNVSQLAWSVWWKPLETPNDLQLDTTSTARVFMDKIGIGEKNPQYALDVRSDVRFQSNIYQSLPSDLLTTMGLAGAPGDYVALKDVLSWIINKLR